MAQNVRTAMSGDPITVEERAALIDGARLMAEHDVGDVLVCDGGALVGILTDRDLAVRGVARGADPINTPVGEVCTRELTVVEADQSVDEALALMREQALRRLPVVEDGRPIGVIALGDLAVQRDEDSVLGEISSAPPNDI